MSTPWGDHRKVKRTMGAVLGDSQKIDRLEHSWLTHILAMSGGIEDNVELAILQRVGPGHDNSTLVSA
jgi:hypothetical protein